MDVIDVWMQHPTRRFLEQPFFDSLRRWTREGFIPEDVPLSTTIGAMDAAGVDVGAKCIELDVPFCVQVGHTGPLRSSETGRPIPYLENVALEFPELRIVAGHIGAPWTQEILSLATKFENLYIDTSAYKATRFPADIVEFLRGRGAKKMMFGTNYPMLTASACLEGVESLGLGDEAKRLFLSENARRVFKLERTG